MSIVMAILFWGAIIAAIIYYRKNKKKSDLNSNIESGIKLDCKACNNSKTMYPTKITKMSPVVVAVGWILTFPSILGLLVAIMLFGGSVANSANGIGIGVAFIIALFSFVGGLLGYLLIMKKNVLREIQFYLLIKIVMNYIKMKMI